MKRKPYSQKLPFQNGDVVLAQGKRAIVVGNWGSIIGCSNCGKLAEGKTRCCGRKVVAANCVKIWDVIFQNRKPASIHQNYLTKTK